MNRNSLGFTLVELMIVVAIIGILVAVAIPSYTSYTARAHVAEAVVLLAGIRAPVSEHYARTGVWPTDLSQFGAITTGNNVGGIVAQLNGAAVDLIAEVTNSPAAGHLILRGTAGGTWTCMSNDIDFRFLPPTCRNVDSGS